MFANYFLQKDRIQDVKIISKTQHLKEQRANTIKTHCMQMKIQKECLKIKWKKCQSVE